MLDGTVFSIDVNPTYDRLRILSDTGQTCRPQDGKLSGVGTSNRLYVLDTTTGVATQVAALSSVPGSSFSALTLSSYGFDFQVDRAGDNLRVLPGTRSLGTPPLLLAGGGRGRRRLHHQLCRGLEHCCAGQSDRL